EAATGPIDTVPRIDAIFHDSDIKVQLGEGGVKPGENVGGGTTHEATWRPSMRFGLVMSKEPDPRDRSKHKRLTYEEEGTTNNTVVRLDGKEWIFGESPWLMPDGKEIGPKQGGHWQERDSRDLGKDASGRERQGRKSVWTYDSAQVVVTQTVELV